MGEAAVGRSVAAQVIAHVQVVAAVVVGVHLVAVVRGSVVVGLDVMRGRVVVGLHMVRSRVVEGLDMVRGRVVEGGYRRRPVVDDMVDRSMDWGKDGGVVVARSNWPEVRSKARPEAAEAPRSSSMVGVVVREVPKDPSNQEDQHLGSEVRWVLRQWANYPRHNVGHCR